MIFIEHEDPIEYNGVTASILQTAWWCEMCGEAILEGKALLNAENLWNELRKED